MKTYIYKILSFFLLITSVAAFMSCEDDFYSPEKVDTNNRVIYTSRMGFDNMINVEENVDFKDISLGVISRKWTFPTSNTEIVGDINDNFVQVFFNKAGSYDVKLHQEFNDVAYDGRADTAYLKVMDTTLVVTVLSHIDITSMKANLLNKDGSLGEEYPLVEDVKTPLPAGTNVRFTYETDDLHDNIDGNFDGAKLRAFSIEDKHFDVRYSSLKVYGLQAIFEREYPISSDTLAYANIFEGVASDAPVDLEEVTDREGNVLMLFSRDIDKASINVADFSVLIHTMRGDVITPEIESAKSGDSEDEVILVLKDNQVYSDDTVWVSYDAGDLESTDAKAVVDYPSQLLVQQRINLLDEWGYDWNMEEDTKWGACPKVAGTATWDSWSGWYGDEEKFIKGAEKSTDQAHDGSQSIKVTINPLIENIPPGQTEAQPNKTLICPLDGGSSTGYQGFSGVELGYYKISVWGYAESKGGGTPNLRLYLMQAFQWDTPSFDDFWIEGEWKKAEQVTEMISVSQPVPFSLMFNVTQRWDNEIVIYLDQAEVVRWYPRPR